MQRSNLDSHIKLLKVFYASIHGKKKRDTPDLFEPKFQEYIRGLIKLEDLQQAVDIIGEKIFMGELGYEIKAFLKRFKETLAELNDIAQKNQLKNLSSKSLREIQALQEIFQDHKQKLHLKVNPGVVLKNLAIYEWCLSSSLLILNQRFTNSSLKKLTSIADTTLFIEIDKSSAILVKNLRDRLSEKTMKCNLKKDQISNLLMKKISEKQLDQMINEVNSSELIASDLEQTLLSIKQEMDQLKLSVKGVKDRIQNATESDNPVSFNELKHTYENLLTSRFLLEEEEQMLADFISAADDAIQSVGLAKGDKQAWLESVAAYEKINVKDEQIESMLQETRKADRILSKLKSEPHADQIIL